MKFRILVKQKPKGLIPVYFPQFKSWGLWWYYEVPSRDSTDTKRSFLFKVDAERFLHDRYRAWQARTNKSTIIPWNPYG